MSLEVIDTESGHRYEYDGQRVPGVTEILEMNDVLLKNAFYEERKEAAAIRGRDVHMACADIDKGGPDWWSDDPQLSPYTDAWHQFKEDFQFKPTAIETPMFHEIYRYAGTPDRFGQVLWAEQTRNVTLDIKATSVVGPHVGIQLGGYNLFADDHEDRYPFAVQLKPNGKYRTYPFLDARHQEAVFLACLTMARWKDANHKLWNWK